MSLYVTPFYADTVYTHSGRLKTAAIRVYCGAHISMVPLQKIIVTQYVRPEVVKR